MGKLKGFLQYPRQGAHYRPVKERLSDYREVEVHPDEEKIKTQGARCMECGTPFCHSLGCPLGNLIPEVNDAAAAGLWREAYERLELTNNFPEVTGRICPALCEASCTLSINDAPVTIRSIEYSVTEHAFREGWVVPRPPKAESGKKTAVIGSGPAGLSAAQQLRRAGHKVTVFEKSDRIGGLLRYGIPNFKLDKGVLERRLAIIASEGVEFETGVNAGKDISTAYLLRKFDAVLIATGSGMPRDIAVPGRELQGIHFALEYLTEANRWASDGSVPGIRADGKNVLVLGGGIRGATAWERLAGRGRTTSPSLRYCRNCRSRTGTRIRPGPSGPAYSGPLRATRRAASGGSPPRCSDSRVPAGKSRRQSMQMSNGSRIRKREPWRWR
jgi:glutamate synthase (NADPH/NADH) small chain